MPRHLPVRTLVAAACAALVVGLVPLVPAVAEDVRVIGGEPAEEGTQPWITSVHAEAGEPIDPPVDGDDDGDDGDVPSGGHRCAASLIAPEWLLSAAHCWVDAEGGPAVDTDQLTAYVGLLAQSDTESAAPRGITEILVHPDHEPDGGSFRGDLALLRLDEPVEDIEPVALGVPADARHTASGSVNVASNPLGYGDDVLTVTGWGRTEADEPGSAPDVRHVAEVNVADGDVCRSVYDNQVNPGLSICAGNIRGTADACQGDSGGPLVHNGFGFDVQVGIVSTGAECGSRDFPGVYTRIEAYGGWIADQGVPFEPIAVVTLPEEAAVGEPLLLDAGGSRVGASEELEFDWDVSDLGATPPSGSPQVRVVPRTSGTAEVTVTVTAADGTTAVGSAEVAVQPPQVRPPRAGLTGVAGTGRVETAAELSRSAFPNGAPGVVVATAGTFPDALAAGPLATAIGGPVLLTTPDALPPATRDELGRLEPERIIAVGGRAAVGADVLAELENIAPTQTIRGDSRFATAAGIAEQLAREVEERSSLMVVATGLDFPDALAGAPGAAELGAPVVLVAPDAVPTETADAIRAARPSRIIVLGGDGAVSPAVVEQLGSLAPSAAVRRVAGADRYDTARRVADALQPGRHESLLVATGADFPDALAAAPVAGALGVPVVLVPGELPELIEPPRTVIERSRPEGIVVLGGGAAIGQPIREALRELIGR